MRITIDTDTDTLDSALRTVYTAYGLEPDHQLHDPELPDEWTEPMLRAWARLLCDDAREVVRFMCAAGPRVGFGDVLAHLGEVKGLGGPCGKHTLGGVMCSTGAARKKIGAKDLPFHRDHRRRLYLIDTRIAAILADELGRAASIAQSNSG